MARAAIGVFLRRLQSEGRAPDRWEAELAMRAMMLVKRGQYLNAIRHVGMALVPPAKRDPVTVREIERASPGVISVSLAILQGIFADLCREFERTPSIH